MGMKKNISHNSIELLYNIMDDSISVLEDYFTNSLLENIFANVKQII